MTRKSVKKKIKEANGVTGEELVRLGIMEPDEHLDGIETNREKLKRLREKYGKPKKDS